MEFHLVDEEYKMKMVGFEVDCADGQGSAQACHNVGDFFAMVNKEYERAGVIFTKNCNEKNFAQSCFNLARLYGVQDLKILDDAEF